MCAAVEQARLTTKAGTYEWLDEWLGEASWRDLAQNTIAERGPGGIMVKLYDTNIVGFNPRGRVVLFAPKKFRTALTKARINRYLPDGFEVHQQGGEWFLRNPQGNFHHFYEGIAIQNGAVV